ncbi:carboxypeptidase regulatory-like domain-containing protein [bacterium]|nr:carboxypeptidase regulatory-like domain-containing protein [bacterium]
MTDNEAANTPGGIQIWFSNPLIEYNTIMYNRCDPNRQWGVGIYISDGSSPIIRYNLIAKNRGGAMFFGPNLNVHEIYNNTIVDNSGRCAIMVHSSRITLTNNIIWGQNDAIENIYGGSAQVNYSNIGGDQSGGIQIGDGVIDEDPLFEDPDHDSYYLTIDSPCIDTGDPDFDEDPDGSRADMGCFWFGTPFDFDIEQEAFDYGYLNINEETVDTIRVITSSEVEDAPDILVEIELEGDVDWLEIDPLEAEMTVNDTMDVILTVIRPEGENAELGQRESVVVITPNDIDRYCVEIPITAFLVEGFGSLHGIITDSETGSPMPDVNLVLEGIHHEISTDSSGSYILENLPAWTYEITIEEENFLPYSEVVEVGNGENIEHNILLLYAACEVSPAEIYIEARPDTTIESSITIYNAGTGPVDYDIERRFPSREELDWETLLEVDAAYECDDDRLQGIEFDGEYFYVAGGYNGVGRGRIHIFQRDGRYVTSFNQFRDAAWGMRDLAWDGELLWGVDNDMIFGFTNQGNMVTRFAGPFEMMRGITWDPIRDLLWVCERNSDLIGIDSEGDPIRQIECQRNVDIYGLATLPDDVDGFTIYAFCRDGRYDTRVMKVNPETGEWRVVEDLRSENNQYAGGICITRDYHRTSWVFAGVLQGDNDINDEFHVWRMPSQTAYDPWEQRNLLNAEEPCEDERLQGIVMVGDSLYISGGNNGEGLGKIHVLTRDGRYIRSFDQMHESNFGIRDLTWDGELLWGSDSREIFGFTTNGILEEQLQGPHVLNRAITYDPLRDLFWVCDIATNLIAIDRDGSRIDEIERNDEYHIFGLSMFNEDPDGFTIYAFCRNGDYETQINKINPETGAWRPVANLESVEELKAGGFNITTSYDPMSFVAICMLQGRDDVGDHFGVWQISNRTDWFILDTESGVIEADDEEIVPFTIDASGFHDEVDLEAEFLITHNGRGLDIMVPMLVWVTLEVDPLDRNNLPQEFKLGTPYPNPFNSTTRVGFDLPVNNHVQLDLIDLSGRRVRTLVDEPYPAGTHQVTISADELPSGVYILLMRAGDSRALKKVVLVK